MSAPSDQANGQTISFDEWVERAVHILGAASDECRAERARLVMTIRNLQASLDGLTMRVAALERAKRAEPTPIYTRLCLECDAEFKSESRYGGYCRSCLTRRHQRRDARRKAIERLYPDMPDRIKRPLGKWDDDDALEPERLAEITDEQFLSLNMLGPKSLAEFRAYIARKQSEASA